MYLSYNVTKMSNPYVDYYLNQSGSGLAGFSGTKYQRGHGFFSRLFGAALPLLKQLFPIIGRQAASSGVGLAQDLLSGANFKESAKTRLREAGSNLLDKASARLQKGAGRKRKRSKKAVTGKKTKKGKKSIKMKPKKKTVVKKKLSNRKYKSFLN
jgi:hypothetical protein